MLSTDVLKFKNDMSLANILYKKCFWDFQRAKTGFLLNTVEKPKTLIPIWVDI